MNRYMAIDFTTAKAEVKRGIVLDIDVTFIKDGEKTEVDDIDRVVRPSFQYGEV